jgi:hypothetical protein
MKYTIETIESQASPLFQVRVIEDDKSVLQFQVSTNNPDDIDDIVLQTYQSIKNPSAPKEPSYKDKRQNEYPPVEDYLDGIVKGNQDQVKQYIDACKAVKAKYSKV